MEYDLYILKRDDFDKFIDRLEKDVLTRVARDMSFLKEHGLDLRMPFAKRINNDLWELRTSGKQKVRILYSIKGKQIYVAHWFIKKGRKIPKKELLTATRRLTSI